MLSVRKNEYPSKQTVNLVFRERSINSPSRAIPAFLLFLVFLALFVRFGVQGQDVYKRQPGNTALWIWGITPPSCIYFPATGLR